MTAPSYGLVATDLDGTLLRSDNMVSSRTKAALAACEEAGMLLVFVTGRPPRWMPPVVEQTGHRGLAICANGALVYDLETEQVVGENPIAPEVAARIVESLRVALPGIAFAVERSGDLGFGHEPAYRVRYEQTKAITAEVEELIAVPVAKILARHPELSSDELLRRAHEVVGDMATPTHSSSDGLLEISGAGVSKAIALEDLAASHDLSAADVIAFGDMPNDLPMLGWAGHGVAVANAHPDVLEAADEVTASNDDDGVAQVLERVLAGGGPEEDAPLGQAER